MKNRWFALIVLLCPAAGGAGGAGEKIVDNGDPGFSQNGFEAVRDSDAYQGDAAVAAKLTDEAYARYAPGLTGRYDVYLYWRDYADKDTDVPWTVTHAGGQATHRFVQRHNPGWHFHGSYILDADSRVELEGRYKADRAVVADAVKLVPTARRVVRRTAKDTLTPVELNHGDELEFVMRSGQVRRVKLIGTSAKVRVKTDREDRPVGQYGFQAVLEIDGKRHEIQRVVPAQESFYEPLVVDGMRVWLDAVSDIFVDDGGFLEERDVYSSGTSCRPKRKARLAVNDAGDRICPEPIAWWYPESKDHIDVRECYRGEDVWMGPYIGKKAHGGLDINMKSGTPLFAPIDFDDHYLFDSLTAGDINNRWRGIRRWPNGSVWWLQAHHLNKMLVDEHGPLKRGTRYAETAGVHVGVAEHTHFVFRVFEEGEAYYIDPWIFFWQTFQDRKTGPTRPTGENTK